MRSLALAVALALLSLVPPGLAGAATLEREVFGYYPYWVQAADGSDRARWRWDLVSIVGAFSFGVAADGTLSEPTGWATRGPALVEEAHAHGVKVVLVATQFDSAKIHAILTTGRTKAIAELRAKVRAYGLDGVNLDFEGVTIDEDRALMVSFVAELATALRADDPAAHLSLATPAVDWPPDSWDEAGLLDAGADYLMIMAYDYHWRNGNPGPVSPLEDGAVWTKDVTETIDAYVAQVGPSRSRRLILGLPLYGYDWPSDGPYAPGDPGTKLAAAESVFFDEAGLLAAMHGRMWDDASSTPYYQYQASGTWHQVWYDDVESLSLKLERAVTRDLGGVGFWALNYDDADPALWGAVETYLAGDVPPPPPPDGGPALDGGPGPPDGGGPPATCEGEGCQGAGCACTLGGATPPTGTDGRLPAGLLLGGLGLALLRRGRTRG